MKNLKIQRKVMVICAMFGAVLTAVSGMGYWQMRAMNNAERELADEQVPQAIGAERINTATSDYEAALAQHVMSDRPDLERAALQRRDDAARRIGKELARLREVGLDEDETHQVDAFTAKWTGYEQTANRIVALSGEGRDKEAAGLLSGTNAQFDDLSRMLTDFAREHEKHIGIAADDADNDFLIGALGSLAALIVAALTVGFALQLMRRYVARPLARMSTALTDLGTGRLDVSVPVEANDDEVGDLARAMSLLRDRLSDAEAAKQAQSDLLVGTIGAALGGLARGDLTTRIDADLSGPFESLKADFNAAATSLSELVQAVSANASDIDTGAAQIRAASDDLAQRTEQQAHALETTASTLNAVSSIVHSTADSAGSAAQAMHAANDEAIEGGIVVKRAMEAMTEIESSTDKVNRIVDVIDGIAFQTNLLALNAGVEAARAGDAGKGFAVVATEVRALAQRSADAARDIKTLIGESNQRVVDGVTLVSDTGALLGRIVERITAMTSMIGGIADSSQGQAAQIGAVNTTIGEMDRTTQQNAAMVEETTAAARSLASKAAALTNIVSRFRTGAGQPAPAANREKAAEPTVRRTAPAPVTHGNLALASDDWSEF